MAYNPGISYRGGDYIAAGISQGVESIVGGLMQRAQKRKQKEEWEKAAPQLQTFVDRLAPGSGIKVDKDTPKEMVPQLLQMAGSLQREQQEAPLRAIQIENEQLRRRISQRELEDAATNADALRGAAPMLRGETEAEMRKRGGMLAPGQARGQMRAADPGAAFASYAERGGTNPRVLAQLGELAAAAMKQSGRSAQPRLVTLGNDAGGRPVQAVIDANGNTKVISAPKAATVGPTMLARLIRERDAYRASGRDDVVADYDDQIKKLNTASGGVLEQLLAGRMAQGAAPSQPVPATPAAPVAPAAAGAPRAPQRGQRVAQAGKVYEFDGAQWVEVQS